MHCRSCDSVVEVSVELGLGVPVAACPHCGRKLRLALPGRPDIQTRGGM